MKTIFLSFILLSLNAGSVLSAIGNDTTILRQKNYLLIKADNFNRSRALANDSHEVYKPFLRIYFGGFHAVTESSITINSGTLGKGTTIDPEEHFGHSDKKVLPRAELIINPGKRHEINFGYWTARRSRTRTLEENVQFKDTTFYLNTSVTSKFNFSSYSLSYRYYILAKPHWSAGVSLGAKVFDSYSKLTANLNGHTYSADKRVYAPVPLPGIHVSINSGEHILIRGTAEYFKLHINDYDFHTADFRGGIEFYPVKHIGIGVDYHYFDTLIRKVPSGNFDGEIDWRFHAVSLYLGIRI